MAQKHEDAPPPRVLEGVRVVDFTRLLPGAYCTWLLAALGARVTKVEQPGRGDYQRDIGTPAGARGSALFQLVNQGKRSLALDLKGPGAGAVLERLRDGADVVVEGFRPGVARRLGIDFDAWLATRPELVCVSISGFGANSPLAARAAHDINYLALSGLLHRAVSSGDGIPELPLADLVGGGSVAAMGVLALLLRARTAGVGGVVDASLADGVPLLPYEILAAAMAGETAAPRDELEFSGNAPHYGVYRLRDGFVAVGAVERPFWQTLCERLGLPGLADADPFEAGHEAKASIARELAAMTRAEARARFEDADACVTVVETYAEMLASPHAVAREYTAPPPAGAALPRIGSPFFHDGRRQFADGPAPLPGEHGTEILRELGFTDAEVTRLVESGTTAVAADSNSTDRKPSP